ncbi:hypothetical protein TIFTF001_020156 [Ficus carica]|uniref:Uncharacterized protein n=1 Tax=Ficus carica TaxID=3494 RepID=A0AA88DAS6_FICCA|nr:hypothetical protein TIFTF001_020156 [Ficus carica]
MPTKTSRSPLSPEADAPPNGDQIWLGGIGCSSAGGKGVARARAQGGGGLGLGFIGIGGRESPGLERGGGGVGQLGLGLVGVAGGGVDWARAGKVVAIYYVFLVVRDQLLNLQYPCRMQLRLLRQGFGIVRRGTDQILQDAFLIPLEPMAVVPRKI